MDTAFKHRPWPSCTTGQLKEFVAAGHEKSEAMASEIERRGKVAAGDLSVAYPAERLRAVQARA
jgi:hypothetical protein